MLLLTSFVTIGKRFGIRRRSGRLEHPDVYYIVFFAAFRGFTEYIDKCVDCRKLYTPIIICLFDHSLWK